MIFTRRFKYGCFGLLLFAWPLLSFSDFPTRPLTLIIGFNPGGSVDRQAQIISRLLEERLTQSIEIVYHAGAGGATSAAMLAFSREQGYVLQYGPSHTFVFTPLASITSYEPQSFRYIAALTRDQLALVTASDKNIDSWEALLAYWREQGELRYATQILLDRYIMRSIAEQEGLALQIIPTSGGRHMSELLLNGNVDLAFSGGTHQRFADQMTVLASFGSERLIDYPDRPSVEELGYPYSLNSFGVFAVPADTPDTQIEVLSQALAEIIEDPRFIRFIEQEIQVPIAFLNEAQLTGYLERQAELFRQLVEDQRP